MRQLLIIIMACILSACALIEEPKTTQKIDMYMENGDKAGTASFLEQPDGVKIELKLKGLSPGYHGLHLHETGSCKGTNFKSAGNHFNPEDNEHGLLYPKGAHAGDLKNIEADQDGKVNTKVMAQGLTLIPSKNKSIMENEGTSLIVTSKADDGMTQISGDSGERIICGELKAKNSDK